MKVLIVDDEQEICSLLEEFLSQRGYAVVTATSGEEGISKFAVMKPDLVLLDIRMPDIDGLQVLKQIKQSDPQTGTIMITAIKDSDTVKQALTMGVNDYIVKPIDLNHLEKLLTSWQRLFAA
ncbi:MAG TPA: response regulator [Firmicutes bacterium]|nr:response regulator [Bacillota bacterium]